MPLQNFLSWISIGRIRIPLLVFPVLHIIHMGVLENSKYNIFGKFKSLLPYGNFTLFQNVVSHFIISDDEALGCVLRVAYENMLGHVKLCFKVTF
jgi:hypothetical protein